jgi:two-component system, chemotaxis family, protein-glutamate methylesterase/glutaminase
MRDEKRRMNSGDVVRRKVFIVDDSALIRHTLCRLFKREPDFDVCGTAENGREAIEAVVRLNPDLIVLDLSMPVMNGLQAAGVLKHLLPSVPIILFSMFEGGLSEKHIKQMGISEVVSKSDPVSLLLEKAHALVDRIAV